MQELLAPILTVLVGAFPFIIRRFEKRDKLKTTIYLMQLIKTKDELEDLIAKHQVMGNSTILVEKLKKNLSEIESEINKSKRRFTFFSFYTVIFFEIIILFYLLPDYLIGNGQREGIFAWWLGLYALLFFVLSIVLILSIIYSKIIREYIKNKIVYNLSVVFVFNLFLVPMLYFVRQVLEMLDRSTTLF